MILVAGCGFLGQYILKELSGVEERITATYRENKPAADSRPGIQYVGFDVCNSDDINNLRRICGDEPMTVFYLISCHNIDYVYKHPEEAKRINVDALDTFLSSFGNIEKLFYASTDCVYGEGNKRFAENDKCRPVNTYGYQKREAEKLVLSRGFNVLRFPYMLGPSLSEKKNFFDRAFETVSANETLSMFDGLRRSVLSYRQAAHIALKLSELDAVHDIINVSGDDSYTKYEMGLRIAGKAGKSQDLIKKTPVTEADKYFSDRRSDVTVMDNSLLKTTLNLDKLNWECD